MEQKLIGKVVLTEEEVGIAVKSLFEQDENFRHLSHHEKEERISDYWLENGKKDCSFLNLIQN
jgi:hypothetical protein